jgi:hypothetical protein
VKAWQMGLAYCYISNAGYDAVPSWLADYADLLNDHSGAFRRIVNKIRKK